MKCILVEEKDLSKYNVILNARPYRCSKVNKWWRDAVEKYSLDADLEWRINFTKKQFEGRER